MKGITTSYEGCAQEISWGQFDQPTDAKRICAGTQHLAQKYAVQCDQQNCAQLY